MSEVLVIGAGPAGLTAAYELSKLGMQPVVVEADAQVGGLSRTVNYNGYRFDIGGHRFFSKVQLINDLWREILADEFLTRPRLSRIYYDHHFFDYPLQAANALAGLGSVEALLVALSYAKAKLLPHQQETNFEQWVSNRFGQRLYEIFFKSYTEKVWGIPCAEISADWAVQRIKNLSLHEALRNALFGTAATKDGQTITSLIETFHYPRLGPGQMWEQCERLLAQRGAQTLRGIKIEKIRHHGGRVQAVYGRNAAGEALEFGGAQVISTMPLRSLMKALDPLPPDPVLQAANRLRYRDYLTAALIVKRQEVFPDNWIYIHAPEVKIGRIQNYKNWSPDMVPDATKTSLGLEYFLWQEDEMWRWSDDRLLEFGIGECAALGIIEAREVEDGAVVRMKKAYPIYDHTYAASLATVRGYLETLANLQTIGRNGLHRYNNQDHSMLTGIYAARNLAGENFDVWSVNTEPHYLEEDQAMRTTAGDRLVPVGLVPEFSPGEDAAEVMLETLFARLDAVAMGGAVGVVSGLALFLATALLLLKGGAVVGPNLSLLSYYFFDYRVTWAGAFLGLVEAGAAGFILGYLFAYLRNLGLTAYAWFIKRRAESQASRDLL
ncbi:MAG: NAD(P)/FAD-dependent oxidoreductase [Acidobacteria bacterium]|nr:NAD(P)/FAD-dependent oxidoreductase [Acidobacteriota bacterium]